MNQFIASYTPHELFGEEDIMNNVQKRTFGAICESATGECIMIKKRDFFLRILREDCAKQYLTQRLQNKNNRMQEKMQSIKDFVYGFQNFLYNDQEGLKKQKEVSSEILKSETFNESAIKKFVQKSNHQILNFNNDSNGKESQSPTETFTQTLSTQSPYQNRRSVASFMNLFSSNKLVDHTQPIIPMFENKRQSLAVNSEQFSPLLRNQKSQQPGQIRPLLKLQSSQSAINGQGELLSPIKLIKEQSNENDMKDNKEQFQYSIDTKNQKQELIKRFSGLIDVGRFNDFKVKLRKSEKSKTQIRLSSQYNSNSKDQFGSFSDLPENTQTNTKPNQQSLNYFKLSQPSFQIGSQTIMENTITQENNQSEESECLSPSSPQLIKNYKNISPESRSKLTSYIQDNNKEMFKTNSLIKPKSSDNTQVLESANGSQRSSFQNTINSEQKIKIFENIKFKIPSYSNQNSININSSTLLRQQTKFDEEKVEKVLPRIIINNEVSSPFERNKKTPKVNNTTKSLGQDELNMYKKSFIQLKSSNNTERITHSQSVNKNSNLPLYYNQMMLNTSSDDKRIYQLRNTNSLDRQNGSPLKNIRAKNSIIQISQSNIQNGSMSPYQKKINFSKLGSTNRSSSDGKNILFNKQHVQAGQRIGDIMDKMILKQQEFSHKTLENLQNNSICFNKNSDNFPSSNKFSNFNNNTTSSNSLKLKDEQLNSFFNGFKNHMSVGTQFSSLINQLDKSKLNQMSQTERTTLKQIPKLKQKI